MKEQKVEKIYDYPVNDSRIPVAYNIVNNESIGGGGFGEVFKVRREFPAFPEEPQEEQFFALKRIRKEGIVNEKDKHYRILSEIKIQRTLKNKYICKYEHSFEDDQAIYIVMEYCEKKSIDDYLKTRKAFTEYETRYYMFQVLLGLKYLRQKKVIHRDLTLANLFLKDYKTIKIGDFGLSYIETENEEKPGLMCGTQGYFTPESLQTKYSYKTDIFCFGVCIYHMMTGLTLFKDSASSFEMIKKGEIKYDEKTKFSKECKNLFEQIFVFENKRIDLDEIYVHPFFNKGIGLEDVDFPNYFDEKMSKRDFEEKIKNLEKNVIMSDVNIYPKKNDDTYSPKKHEFSLDKDGIINLRKNVHFNFNQFVLNDKNQNQNKRKKNANLNLNNSFKSSPQNNEANNLNNNEDINILKDSPINKLSEKKLPLMILDVLNQKKKEKEEKENNMNESKKPGILNLANIINESNDDEEEKEINESKEKNIGESNGKISGNNENNILNGINSIGNNKNSDILNAKIDYDNKNNIDNKNLLQNIYIKNIIEENDKAGIGYQLNNDDFGILFNDDSVMTKFSKFNNIIYYRNPIDYLYKLIFPFKSIKEKNLISKINFFNYIIEEAVKKKSRMKFIKNNEEDSKNDTAIYDNQENNINKKDIYLVKYKKNSYAYFFLLSNNNIQIRYMDGIDVIFCCSRNKKIIYIEHNKSKKEFQLEPNKDFCDFKCKESKINKRIKYAIKEIIR